MLLKPLLTKLLDCRSIYIHVNILKRKKYVTFKHKISGGKKSYYLGKSSYGNEHEISTLMQYSLLAIVPWT
jgi:hypothetical protein